MAKCEDCKHDMSVEETVGCVAGHYRKLDDGKIYEAIPYKRDSNEMPDRCHDCNVAENGWHHAGCDMERCPKCESQLITCGHLKNKWYVDKKILWERARRN